MTTSVLEDTPMAFLRELIRSGKKALGVVGVTGGGLNIDILIGSDVVSLVETCSIFMGSFGPAPNFQRRLKSGNLKMKDNTCGVLYSMIQAAAMGVPFVPVRGLLGTDLLRYRDDFKVVENPFNRREDVVLSPALRPDVASFHGLKGDRMGNVVTPPRRDDLLLAQASKKVVVTVEELVDGELTAPGPDNGTFIPAIYVDAVVHVPLGAHPASFWHTYDVDHEHVKRYMEASQSDSAFADYLGRYVYGVSSHEEYLGLVGLTAKTGGRQ
jgi:glutaconate CoA-transferase subunit A